MTPGLGAVLVTSAARKIPLIRAVRDAAVRIDPEAAVIAGDLDRDAPARHAADDFWLMGPLQELDLTAFLEGCKRRGVRTILPTRDGELAFWAERRPALEQAGVQVVVSSPEAVRLCLDKLAFARWGEREGAPVIPAAQTVDGLAHHGRADQRFVVKERFGAGSKAVAIGVTAAAARSHAQALSDPIVQPMIEGPEISIDAWMTARGAVHGLVLRRRDRVVNGESQISTTFRDAALEAQAATVLQGLGLSGPAVMQAILTPEGLAVIEVNARFGGASTTSIAAGLDMLYWSLFERVRPDAPTPAFHRRAGEVRLVRVPQDMILHDPDL